jgi:hypothetical protein
MNSSDPSSPSCALSSRIDVTLEVGAATESITANETAPLLKTESSEVSHDVTSQGLDELPLGSAWRNPQTVIRGTTSFISCPCRGIGRQIRALVALHTTDRCAVSLARSVDIVLSYPAFSVKPASQTCQSNLPAKSVASTSGGC